MYRSFASNNSGDTLMVARFETVEDADALLAELPEIGAFPDRAQWRAFFASKGATPEEVHRAEPPESVMQRGRTLLATGYGLGEELLDLQRALWACRATTIYRAEHLHACPHVVVAIDDPARTLDTELPGYGLEPARRGPVLLGYSRGHDWQEVLCALEEDLGDRRWTAEFLRASEERWVDVLKQLDNAPWSSQGYFCVRCRDPDAARALQGSMHGGTSRAGDTVLCEVSRFRPRLGQHMSSFGGAAWWVPRVPLQLRLWAWSSTTDDAPIDEAALRAVAAPGIQLELQSYGLHATVETTAVHERMRELQRVFEAFSSMRPHVLGGVRIALQQPLLEATRRVQLELRQ